jgi:hypothetical protein
MNKGRGRRKYHLSLNPERTSSNTGTAMRVVALLTLSPSSKVYQQKKFLTGLGKRKKIGQENIVLDTRLKLYPTIN